MKNRPIIILIFLMIGNQMITKSQDYIPQISSPSPTAYSLGKYSDVPVSKHSGIPNINIPLYTIKTKTIEMPISISYHAGGVKVREEASKVGLGWALNAGGMITQSVVYGNDLISDYVLDGFESGSDYYWGNFCNLISGTEYDYDGSESSFGFPQINYTNPRPDLDVRDPQIDIFHFNFLGYSGKFIFDKKNQKAILLEQQPIVIEVFGEGLMDKYWEAFLPDGTKLKFTQKETVDAGGGIISNITWYLTSITTTKGETIDLSYEVPEFLEENLSNQVPGVFERQVHNEFVNSSGSGFTGLFVQSSQSFSKQSFIPVHLKAIHFPNGKIDFEYGSRDDVQNNKRLTNVKVSKLSGELIRNYQFDNNSYFVSEYQNRMAPQYGPPLDNHYTHRLKLNGIQELVSNQKYTFSYNDATKLPVKDSYAVDYWGYYNGSGGSEFVPDVSKYTEIDATTQSIQNHILQNYSSFIVRDRSANPGFMDAAMLEKVTYPTGGSVEFEYEPNTFSNQHVLPLDNDGNSIGGGLRIAKITKKFSGVVESIITYDYRTYNSTQSSGVLFSPLSFVKKLKATQYWTSIISGGCIDCSQTYDYYVIESDNQIRLSYGANGRAVGYSSVIEKRDENGDEGIIEYKFHNNPNTRFYYPWSALGASPPSLSSRLIGCLKEEVIRKGGGQISKVNKYSYQERNQQSYHGMIGFLLTNSLSSCAGLYPSCSSVGYVSYRIRSARVDLDSKEEIEYVNGVESIKVVTDYQYNNNGQVIESRFNNSNGKTYLTKYKYPDNYSFDPGSALEAMIDNNIVIKPIEVIRYVNGIVSSASATKFEKVGSNDIIVPREFYRYDAGGNAFEESPDGLNFSSYNLETAITKYDNYGDVLTYETKKGVPVSFIWSYDKSLPIAKVSNANDDEIRCTSFEDPKLIIGGGANYLDFDGWVFTGAAGALLQTDGMTGTKCMSAEGQSVEVISMGPFTGDYYLDVALKGNGEVFINNISQGNISTTNEWKFNRYEISLNNSAVGIQVTNSLFLDELRFYPSDAQMTTYTYDPLIGMISETDPNGKTTYYEYDDFGRLVKARDDERNILNTYEYNIQEEILPIPTNLSIENVSHDAISLSWDLIDGLNYNIYRSVNNGGFELLVSGLTTNSYIDHNINPMTQYSYKVASVDNGLVSDQSNYEQVYTPSVPPVITSNPSNSIACEANSVIFNVIAVGYELSYQWQLSTNGGTTYSNMTGATGSSYTIPSTTALNDGFKFRCIVTDSFNQSVTSGAASLTVNIPVSITSQPTGRIICPGDPVTFSVGSEGTGRTFQWRKNGTNIPGATSSSYSINSPTTDHAGTYSCVITGACNTVTTNNAALTINTTPSIITQPVSRTVCEGDPATFSVVASGTGLSYQWQLSTNGGATYSNMVGAKGSSYNISSTTSLNNGFKFRCIVNGTCSPSVTSGVATLMVNTPVSITSQPTGKIVCSGEPVTFSVGSEGTGRTFQWRKNGTNIPGAKSSTYSLSSVSVSHAGTYSCVISGTCGNITSNNATLTVNTAPSIITQPVNKTVCEGDPATFSVSATGTGLSYQWQLSTNGGATYSNMVGATGSSYNISNTTSLNNGFKFRCIVSGTCSPSEISGVATLMVNTPVSITSQPTGKTVCPGEPVTFSVGSEGTGRTFQWRKNGTNIPGAKSSTYSLSSVNVSYAGTYSCVISGTCGNITSNNATLTVNTAPSIITQPINKTVCEGDPATFSVVVSGTELSYQWQISINGGTTYNNLSGATGSSYNIPSASSLANGAKIRCFVRGSCGLSVTSSAATLTVNKAPAITSHPSNISVLVGRSAIFSVVASGTGLSYQWQVSTNGGAIYYNISGAISSSYTVSNAQTNQSGYKYRCRVSGTCSPGVTSNAATLSVSGLIKPKPILKTLR